MVLDGYDHIVDVTDNDGASIAQVAKARKLFPDSRKDLATALSNIRFWSWYRISTFQTNQLGKFDLEQIEKYKVEKS